MRQPSCFGYFFWKFHESGFFDDDEGIFDEVFPRRVLLRFAPFFSQTTARNLYFPILFSKKGRKGEKTDKKRTNLDVVDRVGLERMHHVRELHPVPDEKDRHVVSHQIPVPFSRVELDGEAAGVADRLGRAALMDDGREARDDRGLGSRRAEEVGAGQVRDVVGGLEEALGGGAAGVDDALRDALAVELEVVVGGVGVGVGEVALERFLEGECRETKREEDMMKKKDKRMKKKNEKLLLFLSLDQNSRSRASRRGGSPRAGSGLFLLFFVLIFGIQGSGF